MIKPLKDLYFVSLDEEKNAKTESGIFMDTSWNPMHHATQVGIIESLPLSVTVPYPYKNDVEIKIGDKAYFHHFVQSEDNFILDEGKKLYKCPRYHLYCIIRNGIPVMVDEWILVTPVLETEEDITKTFGTLKLYTKATPDRVEGYAIARHISKEAQKQGIKVGDTIIYRKDADYEMKIEGKEYYRMKLPNVVSVIRGDKLIPLRDEIMLENTAKKEQVTNSGIILPKIRKDRQQTETIVAIGENDEEDEFKVGDSVSIFWYTGAGVNHKGKNYIFLRQEELIGKFTA